MRAIRARYDPYEQTRGRVEQLKSLGHSVDKVRSEANLCRWMIVLMVLALYRLNLSSWEARS